MNTLTKLYSSVHLGSIIIILCFIALFSTKQQFSLPTQVIITCACFAVTFIFAILVFLEVCSMQAITSNGTYWICSLLLSIIIGLIAIVLLADFVEYVALSPDSTEDIATTIAYVSKEAMIFFTIECALYIPIFVRAIFFEEALIQKQKEQAKLQKNMFR